MQLCHIWHEQQLLFLGSILSRILKHDHLFAHMYINQIGITQRFNGIHMGRYGICAILCQFKI